MPHPSVGFLCSIFGSKSIIVTFCVREGVFCFVRDCVCDSRLACIVFGPARIGQLEKMVNFTTQRAMSLYRLSMKIYSRITRDAGIQLSVLDSPT